MRKTPWHEGRAEDRRLFPALTLASTSGAATSQLRRSRAQPPRRRAETSRIAARRSRCACNTYHGGLASASKWPSAVVPKPPKLPTPTPVGSQEGRAVPKSSGHGKPRPPTAAPSEPKNPIGPRIPSPASFLPTAPRHAKPVAPHPFSSPPVYAPTRRGPTAAVARGQGSVALGDIVLTELGISVRHLDRLLGGLVLATSAHVESAKLLRRTFGIDATRCSNCAGHLRLLTAITGKATAMKIRDQLRLSAAPNRAANSKPRPGRALVPDGRHRPVASPSLPAVKRRDAGTGVLGQDDLDRRNLSGPSTSWTLYITLTPRTDARYAMKRASATRRAIHTRTGRPRGERISPPRRSKRLV